MDSINFVILLVYMGLKLLILVVHGLISNTGATSGINKKGTFYKKGHLKFQHPLFKPFFQGFTTK